MRRLRTWGFQIPGLHFLDIVWCQCKINCVCCHRGSLQTDISFYQRAKLKALSDWSLVSGQKSSLRPDSRETFVRPCVCVCVKENRPDSGEGEVRKGVTKRIIRCAEYACPWLPPRCPPLIHLPQLIWFPLMFQRRFDTGGPRYSACTVREKIGLTETAFHDWFLI